ncbi:hypothetical protein ElyMa_003966300 [Elysia marginata]|uniref:Major capsid protein n=1 Tax=Elysia marginata TaxID=1093978 RepID=A0AAV4FVJ1_9GAST|nr:hypothetical protein ElyMa_003966300 [Elysia marginata]
MNTNTSMVQVFANDRSPLSVRRSTARHVNDVKNNTEWLLDQITKYTEKTAVTAKDINTSIDILLASKFAQFLSEELNQSTFGCMFQGVTTIEEINENVSFTLSYLVNTSKNNVKIDGAIPKTSLTAIDRTIIVGPPLKAKIEVSKDVFRALAEFLKIVGGYWLRTKERVAMGGPLYHPKDNEKSMLVHSKYNNFMKLMDTHSQAAADLLIALDNSTTMIKVCAGAQSSTVLRSKGEVFKNVASISDIAKRLIASKSQQTFGIAKNVPGQVTAEMNISKSMFEFLSVFLYNSDNDGAMPDLMPRFSGPEAKFERPDVIVCAPGDTINYLLKIGMARKDVVTMHQYTTKLTLEQSDMNPLNTVAPQNSVTLKNGSYVRDDRRQLMVEEVTKDNHELVNATIGGIRVAFVDLDGNSFVDSVSRISGLRNMTTIDRILPCGIIFTKKNIAPLGPVRQTTTFTNENGTQYTMSVASMRKFLVGFFESAHRDHMLQNIDEDPTNALSSMVFYRINEDGDKLLLNKFMVDNYYYNPDLMCANLISVLENSTSMELDFIFNKIYRYDEDDDDDDDDQGGAEEEGEGGGRGRRRRRRRGRGRGDDGDDEAIAFAEDNPDVQGDAEGQEQREGGEGERGGEEEQAAQDNNDRPLPLPNDGGGGGGDDETVEEAMHRWRRTRWTPNLRKNIVHRVQSYFEQKKSSVDRRTVYKVYDCLLRLTNIEAASCLNYINMGFGLYFMKTAYYQTDSLLACRPNGFLHVTGPTQQTRVEDPPDKSQMINYESYMHSVTGRQSLASYPAIRWQDAKIVQSQTVTDDRVVDPTNDMGIEDFLTFQSTMRLAAVEDKQQDPNSLKGDGWLMLFTPPFVCKDVVSKPFTPVGRLGTVFITPEEHDYRFFNQNHMDCQHQTVYTHNAVFSNMINNINTMYLWRNKFDIEEFPFTKYVAFNPTAAAGIKAQMDADTRSRHVEKNQKNDGDTLDIHPLNESNISHFTGVAYPMHCFSSLNRKLGTMTTDDIKFANGHRVKIMNMEGTDFLLNGTSMFGKWDNQVSEFSFYN